MGWSAVGGRWNGVEGEEVEVDGDCFGFLWSENHVNAGQVHVGICETGSGN